mmetsp:Transcript_2575/g.3861  ORF Transcript_2575/g.3861 Transcript_2575/m.3861 type:complete len:245 (-) Transcript_2575:42-776(-)
MTIVSGPETRNSEWANDSSSFGQKMLLKMGWSQGKGLGKNQQGTNTNLRGVRREEGLGIGAKTDTLGSEGFSVTSRNFHGVLANLYAEHGNGGASSSSKKDKKKRKKGDKEKKSNKKDKKKDSKESDSGLTLSSKRVTAGHAQKMRDAKDLTKKSKEDMAAIFGMRVQDYQATSVWGRLSSLSSSDHPEKENKEEKVKADNSQRAEKKKRKKKDKKRKKKDRDESEDAGSSDEGKRRTKKSRKE